jgi:hypothetical protein
VSAAQQNAPSEADLPSGAGVGSITRSGYLMPHARWGARMGHTKPSDIAVIEASQVFAAICEWVVFLPKGHLGLNAE